MNISSWIEYWAGCTPDKVAIRFEGRSISYAARRRVFVGIGEVIQPDAAQKKVDLAPLGVRYRVTEIRGHRDDIDRIDETQLANLGVGKGRNRNTHLLQILLALPRRDDDLFDLLG